MSRISPERHKLFILCACWWFFMFISLLLTHSACHTLEGSSRGSALRCPRSCYWYGRRNAHAAECPAHKTRNNGSIQTRATSRPLHSRSLSRREYETEGKKETIKVLFQWGSTPFQPPPPPILSLNDEGMHLKWRANGANFSWDSVTDNTLS